MVAAVPRLLHISVRYFPGAARSKLRYHVGARLTRYSTANDQHHISETITHGTLTTVVVVARLLLLPGEQIDSAGTMSSVITKHWY